MILVILAVFILVILFLLFLVRRRFMQRIWYPVSAKLVQRKSNRDLQQFLETKMEDEDEDEDEEEEEEGETQRVVNCRGFSRKFPSLCSELLFRRVVDARGGNVKYSVHRDGVIPLDSWEIPSVLVTADLDLLPCELDEFPVPLSLRELLVCQTGKAKLRKWWIPEVRANETPKQGK